MSCPVGRFGHRPKVESALCCPGWGGVGPFPPDSRRSHIAITQSGPVRLDCVSPVLPPGRGLQRCFLFLYLDWKGTVSRPLLPFCRFSRSERCFRPELAHEGQALNSSGPPYLRGLVRAVRIYSGDGPLVPSPMAVGSLPLRFPSGSIGRCRVLLSPSG